MSGTTLGSKPLEPKGISIEVLGPKCRIDDSGILEPNRLKAETRNIGSDENNNNPRASSLRKYKDPLFVAKRQECRLRKIAANVEFPLISENT
jgi:hypothetical protein